MRTPRIMAGLALTAALLTVFPATPASAHPLGNFTVNQHSGLIVTPTGVTIEMVVDMAEIPAFQTRSEIDTDHDKAISAAEASGYRQRACTDLSRGTELRIDGHVLPTTVASSDLAFPPGQAGLATLRLTCGLTARAPQGSAGRLDFVNRNFTDRVGWREITAAGDGVRLLDSDVPARSTTAVLTTYPQDLLSSPLDQRQAHLRVSAAGSREGVAAAPDSAARASAERPNGALARGSDQLTAAFTGLVARQRFTIWFGLMALLAAVALGAVHALAPGHGKTVMAAYLVGEQGSLRQAALLGLTVTSTHTAGVLVLGVLLSGSTAVVPERLYPWLGLTSGAMLAAVGLSLLVRVWRRRSGGLAAFAAHEHHHGTHHHDGHGHHAAFPAHMHADRSQPPMSRKALMVMGAAGGMVPSPSALVVLLGAIALGRTWFGIALVLGYGIGMALTLVGAGLLMVRARATLDGRLRGRSGMARLAQALPVLTASFVVIAGVGLAARAVQQM
jgi:nickel/cobalt transporter (NicO) family protein